MKQYTGWLPTSLFIFKSPLDSSEPLSESFGKSPCHTNMAIVLAPSLLDAKRNLLNFVEARFKKLKIKHEVLLNFFDSRYDEFNSFEDKFDLPFGHYIWTLDGIMPNMDIGDGAPVENVIFYHDAYEEDLVEF